MKTAQHTAGTPEVWQVLWGNGEHYATVNASTSKRICTIDVGAIHDKESGLPSMDEAGDIARLIAEAGTVANETGLTPRQLQEQVGKLRDTVSTIHSILSNWAIAANDGSYKNEIEFLNSALQLTEPKQ